MDNNNNSNNNKTKIYFAERFHKRASSLVPVMKATHEPLWIKELASRKQAPSRARTPQFHDKYE